MAKIVNLQELKKEVSMVKKRRQSIVLVGGCFDLIHIGHIKFLHEAKQLGNILMVLLESDKNLKKLKGNNRPLFLQKVRAEVLSALSVIDYVILLPPMKSDKKYTDLILQIKPRVIAVTANDPLLFQKKTQAESVNSKLILIPYRKTYSSSNLARLLGIN